MALSGEMRESVALGNPSVAFRLVLSEGVPTERFQKRQFGDIDPHCFLLPFQTLVLMTKQASQRAPPPFSSPCRLQRPGACRGGDRHHADGRIPQGSLFASLKSTRQLPGSFAQTLSKGLVVKPPFPHSMRCLSDA